jgi:hypothetical protein
MADSLGVEEREGLGRGGEEDGALCRRAGAGHAGRTAAAAETSRGLDEHSGAEAVKERSHLGTLAMMTILAHSMAGAAYSDKGMPDVSGYQRRPEGYGVHLSKAERKGKKPAELQRMRQERQEVSK